MYSKSLGFIGGGRITRIILGGLKKADKLPDEIVISDVNSDLLEGLKESFPNVQIKVNGNESVSEKDVVFIAVHPLVIKELTDEITSTLKKETIIVSLAPKVSIAKLSEGLGGHSKIVRMIPNAPSIIGEGYNPVAFSKSMNDSDKAIIIDMLSCLGDCPIVPEEDLEAYAIISAMGPTYLWFQLYELQEIGKSFGLTEAAAKEAVVRMAMGAVKTMSENGFGPDSVLDLVPVKPMGNEEGNIKNAYRNNLEGLFKKLKG